MEHRWGERIQVEHAVRLGFGPRVIVTGTLKDASLSGAFIATQVRLPALSRVQVTLSVKRGRKGLLPPHTSIPAHIVRTAAGGVGIEWQEFAPAPIHALLSRRRGLSGARGRPRPDSDPQDALEIV